MPSESATQEDIYNGLGTIALHLIEQLTKINQNLETIADALTRIEERVRMATVLDYQD